MPDSISSQVEQLSIAGALADGTPCRTISVARVQRLADETGVPGWTVEARSLEQGIVPERYLRNYQALRPMEQLRVVKARVCIVGLGGLGGLVMETLARLGIGRLTLVDGDAFEAHNLNRQLLSRTDGLGRPKAEAAAGRVTAINPGIETRVIAAYLNATNAAQIVANSDLVVDCLDNIRSRFILASAAAQAGVPMISAAVAGLSGHITTLFPEDSGLEAIYGPLAQVKADKGEEVRLGCLAPGVNLMASLECAEVLHVLLGKPNTLRNRMLVVDLTDYTFETLQLA